MYYDDCLLLQPDLYLCKQIGRSQFYAFHSSSVDCCFHQARFSPTLPVNFYYEPNTSTYPRLGTPPPSGHILTSSPMQWCLGAIRSNFESKWRDTSWMWHAKTSFLTLNEGNLAAKKWWFKLPEESGWRWTYGIVHSCNAIPTTATTLTTTTWRFVIICNGSSSTIFGKISLPAFPLLPFERCEHDPIRNKLSGNN